MVTINTVALAISIGFIPLFARLADRLGRKPILLAGAVGCVVTTYLYFMAINDANIPAMLLLCILNQGIFYSCWNATWTIFFPEMFSAPVRYTGMAMGNQVGLMIVGFVPAINTAIYSFAGWEAVATFVCFCVVVASVVIMTCRETAFTPLDNLGLQDTPQSPRGE